ncbi:hypothetical protein KEM48_002234 [Puccinia striiformis f. sp. tritici PST-130]|nr:hypothetical protein KEM48_002234 [Puccinia striiformis f. sp. tritici PST-130]
MSSEEANCNQNTEVVEEVEVKQTFILQTAGFDARFPNTNGFDCILVFIFQTDGLLVGTNNARLVNSRSNWVGDSFLAIARLESTNVDQSP